MMPWIGRCLSMSQHCVLTDGDKRTTQFKKDSSVFLLCGSTKQNTHFLLLVSTDSSRFKRVSDDAPFTEVSIH